MRLRRRIPDEVRELGRRLGDGERLATWNAIEGDRYLVATNRALWHPLADGYARTPWEAVVKVTYADAVMTVRYAAAPGDAETARTFRLVEPQHLPDVVRTRVERSVAWSRYHHLTGRQGGVRVVARRRSDDGSLVWSLVYDAGIDPGDPAAAAEAERLLDAAREAFGRDGAEQG